MISKYLSINLRPCSMSPFYSKCSWDYFKIQNIIHLRGCQLPHSLALIGSVVCSDFLVWHNKLVARRMLFLTWLVILLHFYVNNILFLDESVRIIHFKYVNIFMENMRARMIKWFASWRQYSLQFYLALLMVRCVIRTWLTPNLISIQIPRDLKIFNPLELNFLPIHKGKWWHNLYLSELKITLDLSITEISNVTIEEEKKWGSLYDCRDEISRSLHTVQRLE